MNLYLDFEINNLMQFQSKALNNTKEKLFDVLKGAYTLI